jgi:hypothetical protein
MENSQRKIVVCLLGLGMSSIAFAGLDAACMPVIKASETRAAAPMWESVTVISPSNFKMEAMKVGGQFYSRTTGAKNWSKSPINLSEAELKSIAEIKAGKIKVSQCKTGANETIDGVVMQVLTYTVEMTGAPAAVSKLYIGKSDGLPYAQTSAHVKTRFRYTGITAPKL